MNIVEIDTSERPSRFRFSTRFNAAAPFIDRHLALGRGERVAVRTTQGDITYSQLAANVDRCAAAVLARRVAEWSDICAQ
jgi:acyl-coenzyme A synthetase/AMP-(fatty) acid ligase